MRCFAEWNVRWGKWLLRDAVSPYYKVEVGKTGKSFLF